VKKLTLYATSSTGKPKQWSIWTEGGYVCQEWGFVDGKKQSTKDLVKQKNIGKSNETTLDEQAELEAERKLTKKKEEGYSENLSTSNVSEIDWENGILPETFSPAKPAIKIEPELEQQLLKEGRAYYTKKWNGMRCLVITGEPKTNQEISSPQIYSRRIENKTQHFPYHIKELSKLLNPGFVLDCEMILDDDPDKVKEVFGPLPEKSIERQNTSHGKPICIVFDILYTNRQRLQKLYDDRFRLIQNTIHDKFTLFKPIKLIEECIENPYSRPQIPDGAEGMVLWDRDSFNDVNFRGKPSRNGGAYKIKVFDTIDILATSWVTGKGKNNNRPAKLNIGAYKKDGSFLNMGECGSGLCESHKDDILAGKIKFPCVIEIKCEEITKADKFRLPIFLRFREDKKPSEIIYEELIK